jgi:hypothetical protein
MLGSHEGADQKANGRPFFADCRIIRTRGSKRQWAVAGVIQHLIDSVVLQLRLG